MKQRACAVIAGVILAGWLAGDPGFVSGHAGNNDPNAVHACRNNHGGIRIVGVGGTCTAAETAMHWNTTTPSPPPTTGAVSGDVDATCGPVTVTGTLAYLAGISSLAKTGPAGTFLLHGMPVGTYDLVLEVPGRPPHVLNGVSVVAGATTDLGTVPIPNLQNDPQNCGTCGQVCLSGVCTAGQCLDAMCPSTSPCTTGAFIDGQCVEVPRPAGFVCSVNPLGFCNGAGTCLLPQ